MNALAQIDLRPLSECKELRSLDVAGNQLQDIDLEPLSECYALEELYLHSNHPSENQFMAIDLTPLLSCKELEDLGVPDEVDLRIEKRYRGGKYPPAIQELVEDKRIKWE